MTGDVQERCEQGQQELMHSNYLAAERILAAAESIAWRQHDWDTLARLYMPLQEARRQRRQRCSEGAVCLDLLAQAPGDLIDGQRIVQDHPSGQLLVGGWGSIEPALNVRRLQRQHGLYLDVFLAAVFPSSGNRLVAIVPTEDAVLPAASDQPRESLLRRLPRHSLVFERADLPAGVHRSEAGMCDRVMDLWEELHRPFLAEADAEPDPVQRIEKYRQVITVDYACELAHQKLSEAARQLARG